MLVKNYLVLNKMAQDLILAIIYLEWVGLFIIYAYKSRYEYYTHLI